MAEKLIVPDAVRAALDAFRSKELSGRHFLILAYEGKNTLRVDSTGPGFAAEAVALLPDAEVRYVYLRTEHQVEAALTTKYAWLDWTPDAIPPMRKALLSTHKGQVADLLKPTHVSVQASQRSELDEAIVMDLIGGASGTKSNITNKQAFQAPAVDISRSAAAKESDYLPASAKSSRTIALRDEDGIRGAFKAVRSDADPTAWALLQFVHVADGKFDTLELRSTGTGGPAELRAALDPAQPNYALFRTTEQVDRTTAVRFSFLRVVPSTLPASKKAQIGTLGGVIIDLFKPFAFDFDCSSVDDFSEAEVHDKIATISGVRNMALTDNASSASAKVVQPRGAASAPSAGGAAGPSSFLGQPAGTIALDEPLKAALRSLRADARAGETQTHWLVAGKVAGADALTLLAQGDSASVDDLKRHLPANDCSFALLRIIDQIDQSATVKFVYIRCQPESTPALKKSAVSTKLGLYQAVFSPFSTEFFISGPEEISQESVVDKVSSASGSKSKVVAGKA